VCLPVVVSQCPAKTLHAQAWHGNRDAWIHRRSEIRLDAALGNADQPIRAGSTSARVSRKSTSRITSQTVS
jgi:hypothetical protein